VTSELWLDVKPLDILPAAPALNECFSTNDVDRLQKNLASDDPNELDWCIMVDSIVPNRGSSVCLTGDGGPLEVETALQDAC